jgi:hypothetical protein
MENNTHNNVKSMNAKYLSVWYYKHKQQHDEHMKEQVQCTCGTLVGRGNLSRHRKTSRHKIISEITLL